MKRVEHAICEVVRDGRAAGLGFAIGQSHVLTCAHVVNAALGRATREVTDPGAVDLSVVFPIGAPAGIDSSRTGTVVEWLPRAADTFDRDDLALLELTEPAPEQVPELTARRHQAPTTVQMWGPQEFRPDGGHVTGDLLGEVRGGRVQINVDHGPFRVRPGFSGGPVWQPGTTEVVGILAACGQESTAVDAYLLGMDRIGLVWPDWADLAAGPGRTGDDLFIRVASAVRYVPDLADAEVRRTRRGGLPHLLATRQVRVGSRVFRVDHPIAVRAGEITTTDVARVRELLRHYREAGFDITEATLVHTGAPAEIGLREQADQAGIDLRTLPEFQTGVDLRQFAARQHQTLAADERYRADGYVPQRFREPPDREIRAEPLRDRLLAWLAEPEGYLVVVLASFGHGKTYLLHELAREMHERPDYPAVPVLVRLAELERTHHIDELVGIQLHRAGQRRIDLDRLAYLRLEGRVALLLDGFDELARRVSYDEAAAHLEEIVRAAEGRAKVVLTSRREFFLSDRDTQVAFGQRLATAAGRRLVTITDFDPAQIRQFLAIRQGEGAADRWVELLAGAGALDLAANPRMLNLLTTIDEERLRQAGVVGTVNRAWVFDEVLREWLTGEYERANPYGTKPEPWLAAMDTALSALADRMWTAGLPYLAVEHLEQVAVPLVAVPGADRLRLEQAVHLLGSGTLLVRVGDGQFDFAHRSIMEYLVVRRMAALLAAGELAALEPYLANPLSPVQIDLLDELAGRDAVTAWVGAAVDNPAEGMRGNTVAVSQRLGIAVRQRMLLRGQDLRGHDLTGRDLAGADLAEADLTDALLAGADLTGADLTGAMLTRTRLDRAILSGARISGADLSEARLLGADLRGVDGRPVGTARGATLLGAQLGGDAAAALAEAGATPLDTAPELQLPAGYEIHSVAIDPTGKLLAVASGRTIELWDLAARTCRRVLTGHTDIVIVVAWSPDGRQLATGSQDRTARIWAPDTGDLLDTITGHTGHVTGVAWAPDGRRLATGSHDGIVVVWDLTDGVERRRPARRFDPRTHPGPGSLPILVRAVAWSRDGRRLAAGCQDGTVRIWDPATGRELHTLLGHEGWIATIAWSPNARRLATGSRDGTIRIWEPAARDQPITFDAGEGEVYAVAWSPDGTRLAGGDRSGTQIWDTATGSRLAILTASSSRNNAVRALAWSPGGGQLAAGNSYDRVLLWDPHDGSRLGLILTYSHDLLSIAWSPDGRQLAIGTSNNAVQVWDVATGLRRAVCAGHTGDVTTVAWSPDGRYLASGSDDCDVRVWEPAANAHRHALIGHTGGLVTVVWSPNGRQLATTGKDNTVRIWDATTGQWLDTRGAAGLAGVAWSPDGRYHAFARTEDDTVLIWDATTGEKLTTITTDELGVDTVAWSPDSRYLAAAGTEDSTVRILDATTGYWLRTLTGHAKPVRSVAWSPKGQLASGSCDGTARIWNPGTGALQYTLIGHQREVTAVAWSPTGNHLASASWDGTVRIWDTATGRPAVLLLPMDYGSAAFCPDGRYQLDGVYYGEFWWAVGLARFEPGELDPYVPALTRVDPGTPLLRSP